MPLIKSISGIRGTIGGMSEKNLTPIDIVQLTAAYGTWIIDRNLIRKVIIGRDARVSGEIISRLVIGTLQSMGIDVVDLGLSTTPTVEMAVTIELAGGGIVLTASHNPKEWNALKLLNSKGELISEEDGKIIFKHAESQLFTFAKINKLGKVTHDDTYIDKHIKRIIKLPLVNPQNIRKKNFCLIIDCVNSTGSIAIPHLLEELGIKHIDKIHCQPNGNFPYNPEPLPEHITEICKKVMIGNYDLGIIVDPDVDRLALVCEDGTPFGEEYTLVAVADYVLQHEKGNTVSNMSSTQALKDITQKINQAYFSSLVGEVNVVKEMKNHHAVIGGEGNGGIIYPPLHYGRDAMVGIALILSYLASSKKTLKELRNSYPNYVISKSKMELTSQVNPNRIFNSIKNEYKHWTSDTRDGLKIQFAKEWIHLRQSNTESVVRIYAESSSKEKADALVLQIINHIKNNFGGF